MAKTTETEVLEQCIYRECEVIAMARVQTANALSDFRVKRDGRREGLSILKIDSWMRSEIKAISRVVDQLMRLIEGSRCVAGNEFVVELALREALSNAVVHGNEMDAHKLVQVRCRCEQGKGVWLTVKDQGKGFDPAAVPDPVAVERLEEEHGRGIYLMKLAMDEVSFECGGTVVHMWKGLTGDPRAELRTNNAPARHLQANNVQKGASSVAAHANAVVGQRRQAA